MAKVIFIIKAAFRLLFCFPNEMDLYQTNIFLERHVGTYQEFLPPSEQKCCKSRFFFGGEYICH